MSDKLLLPAKIEALTPVQKGWLLMCQKRNETFDMLQKDELKVQVLLKDIEKNDDWEKVKATIKDASDLVETSKQKRLIFTSFINEKVIEAAMAFEKRNFTLLTEANRHEFSLRKKSSEKIDKENKRNSDMAAFIAHVTNEHFRIAAEYRLALETHISESYSNALRQKQPIKQIPDYIKRVKEMMKDIKLPKFVQYEFKKYKNDKGEEVPYITRDEAKIEFDKIPKYDPKNDAEEALVKMDEKFELYKNDLKNSEAAAAAIEKELAAKTEEVAESIETETATNNLMSKASTFSVTGGKTPIVKKSLQVVEENTDSWAFAVISAFIKNVDKAKGHLRVKTWANLKISQMADALSKIATEDNSMKFSGLTLNEIEK